MRFATGPSVVVVAVAPSASEAVTAVLVERVDDRDAVAGVEVAPVVGADVVAGVGAA